MNMQEIGVEGTNRPKLRAVCFYLNWTRRYMTQIAHDERWISDCIHV